jgi:cobalamin transport system substrate-binding protein
VDACSPAARRRRPHTPALLVLLLAAALSLAACAGTAATPGPVVLTDDEGTPVTIPAEPTKIVSLTPAATEILFALGAGDRVVGKVQDISLYPPEAAAIPDVASFPNPPDVEKIVSLGSDLVIAGGDGFTPSDTIQQLRSFGVPVLVLFAPDVPTAYQDIELIGAAVGRPAQAATVVETIRAAFQDVKLAVSGLPAPRVYYELDATNGYFGPAPDYFGTGMMTEAGGDPLTSGTPGVYQIQAEQILAFDPQVILLGDAAYGVTPDQVSARPGWGTLSAVKTGDVRPIDDVIVTRPGPRLADGIRALALAIHPDLVLPSPGPSR